MIRIACFCPLLLMKNAQLQAVGAVTRNPEWSMVSNGHPLTELIVVLSGRMTVQFPGLRWEAVAGDVLLYPPRMWHAEQSDPSDPVETIFMALHWKSEETSGPPLRIKDRQDRIRELSRWLLAEQNSTAERTHAVRQTLFHAILAEFRRRLLKRPDPAIEALRTWMREHLQDDLCLDDLAAQAGMSRFHFVRHYRRMMGTTPMKDLRKLRAERARLLILTTNLPMKAIAPQVGIPDECRLSRLFRQEFHATPGSMRRCPR